MADAWGGSWGTAWGGSWGSVAEVEEPERPLMGEAPPLKGRERRERVDGHAPGARIWLTAQLIPGRARAPKAHGAVLVRQDAIQPGVVSGGAHARAAHIRHSANVLRSGKAIGHRRMTEEDLMLLLLEAM